MRFKVGDGNGGEQGGGEDGPARDEEGQEPRQEADGRVEQKEDREGVEEGEGAAEGGGRESAAREGVEERDSGGGAGGGREGDGSKRGEGGGQRRATREAAVSGGRRGEAKEEAGEGSQVQRRTHSPGWAGGGATRGDSVLSAQSAWEVEVVCGDSGGDDRTAGSHWARDEGGHRALGGSGEGGRVETAVPGGEITCLPARYRDGDTRAASSGAGGAGAGW